MTTTATITIGQGFTLEVEGHVSTDNARDPVRGQSERIVDGDITVVHRSGRRLPLAARYESKAVAALVDAADREDR